MAEQDKLKPQWRQIIKIVEDLENGKMIFNFQDKVPTYIVEAEGKIEKKELRKE